MIQVRSRPAPFRQRLTIVALSATLAIATASAAGAIQSDGTDADTSEVSTECVIYRAETLPALDFATSDPDHGSIVPDGEAIAATPAVTAATPVADASPVVLPVDAMASPVSDDASPAPDGTPVNPNSLVQADIEATVDLLFGCVNEGEFVTLATMLSPSARGALLGTDEALPADVFAGLAASFPATERTLVGLTDFTVIDETTTSLVVTYTSNSQLFSETWTFSHQRVDGLPAWLLDTAVLAPPAIPAGASTIAVGISDTGYTVEPESVSGPDVVLQLRNTSTAVEHEALVLMLDDGVSTDSLLQTTGGVLPAGVTVIGQATVAPGGEGQLVLVGLEPGTYTIVDLLIDAQGLPNLSQGMETTFTIAG